MENCAVLCGINRHLFSFPGEVNLTQILKAIFSGQVNEFSSPFSRFFETWSCYRDLNGLKLGTLPHASQWLELQGCATTTSVAFLCRHCQDAECEKRGRLLPTRSSGHFRHCSEQSPPVALNPALKLLVPRFPSLTGSTHLQDCLR